jgi:tRNA G18 (ribose-2'-O)-methylase SpoU
MAKIIPVTSLEDPLLRDYSQLTDVALRSVEEPQEGLYIAESLKVLERALAAGHTPRSVLTIPTWLEKLENLLATVGPPASDTPVFVADSNIIEQLTGFLVHRGTLASMHRPVLPSIEQILDGARTVVVLENIVDHTNVGAIFRSVAGLGADAVIVSESCADPLYRRSVRVSMGTVMQVPWTRAGNWSNLVSDLRKSGFHLAALALDHNARTLQDFISEDHPRVALMVGSEGDGLSSRALASADSVLEIPMAGGVDSLNVAAASAVALWALQNRAHLA